MKTRTRLSDFQNDVLWTPIFLGLAIWATVFAVGVSEDEFFRLIAGVLLSVIAWITFFVKSIFVNQQLHKMYIYKVKVYEEHSNMEDTRYYFKLLRPFFYFPIWYTDWEYSLDLVERKIERKKLEAHVEREKYFLREVITIVRKK